jgi:uncharacterized membrane protein YvlD (DUF360 family)
MSSGANNGGGEGLSLQTLVVAACASAAAAVIVSHLWKDGTVLAAAMTPVIVAIVKELLQKPMESELVKKPVSRIASGSRAVIGSTTPVGSRSREEPSGHGDPLMPDPPRATEPRGLRQDPDEPDMTPIRTYGGSRTRTRRPRIHLKIALITGLVAFLIAAAALTLPELIFGGAVSSHHSTTLFGGSGKSDTEKDQKGEGDGKDGGDQSDQPSPNDQQTTPATPAPTPDEPTQTATTPAPTTEQPAPQTTQQQPSPVPTTPAPPVP